MYNKNLISNSSTLVVRIIKRKIYLISLLNNSLAIKIYQWIDQNLIIIR
jgi:hypothetical protein